MSEGGRPLDKPAIGLTMHRTNQEEIDNPTDEKEAASEKPDRARNRFAIIEPMRACEAEYPKHVSVDLAVRVWSTVHAQATLRSGAARFNYIRCQPL